MKTRDFYFDLPEELIAQEPPETRGTSRLLVLNRAQETIKHLTIKDLPDLVEPGTVIVLNNSKVRKARLFGTAEKTGGKVEFLFLEKNREGRWKTMVSKSKKQTTGKIFLFPGNIRGRIVDTEEKLRWVEFDTPPDEAWFEKHGHVPLPPYIKRPDKASDAGRYQTVYSDRVGSAAAPTAGLHFTEEILQRLREKGARVVYVTLHVGLGTFLPIRSDDITDHKMHEEHYTISGEAASVINTALEEKRPVMAVGTTAVRTLESAWKEDHVRAGERSTGIYIYPGYRFKVVSRLLTNFHTPESTLLLLVSAFAGKGLIDRAYREAIAMKYRFFSYGDAMFIV